MYNLKEDILCHAGTKPGIEKNIWEPVRSREGRWPGKKSALKSAKKRDKSERQNKPPEGEKVAGRIADCILPAIFMN